MDQNIKDKIDKMSYEQMLYTWRFAPVGSPMFTGEAGEYFKTVMLEKKNQFDDAAHSVASKSVGWEK